MTTKPDKNEIATTRKDLDVFAGWATRLENPDTTLKSEAAGKGLKLYDEVNLDAHAGSVLQTRYLAVTGREWEILPADDSAKAAEIAEFVKATLLDCNFDQARQEMLQAILYGFYPAEVMWMAKDGKIVIDRVRAKHPRRFVFDLDRNLRLLTPASMINGEPAPDKKFLCFTYGSSDNPYGQGLGQSIWWYVWFKKVGIKYWLVFLEKFGMPTAVGKYPPGTGKPEQDELLAALEAIQSESGIKIPNTMLIELLEASRSGNTTHDKLCDYMDRAISKRVLGQTLTTEVKGEGSYAASKTHDDVRQDIIKADADLLCEHLNATLIKWLVDYNFAGAAYPKMWIRTEDGNDLNALAERDERLTKQIKFTKKYYQAAYDLEEDDFELAVEKPTSGLDVGAKKLSSPPAFREAVRCPGCGTFAEGQPSPDTADLLAERLASAAGPALADWLETIKAMLDGDGELADVAKEMTAAFPGLGIEAMTEILARELALANLTGRYEVDEEGHART